MEEITQEEKKLLILKDKCELVINRTERPNSYEFGKAGHRFKLYFSDVEELELSLSSLVESGLALEEDFRIGEMAPTKEEKAPSKEDSAGVNSPAELGQI